LDIASWEAKAKIPLGPQLIRQFHVPLGGLVARQAMQQFMQSLCMLFVVFLWQEPPVYCCTVEDVERQMKNGNREKSW